MKKKVFGSCPKYLGVLTWNHPNARLTWTRGKVRVKPLNINFPFWLKVWQFEGWAETSLTNLFNTLYGNWNCSAPKTGHTYIFCSKGPS